VIVGQVEARLRDLIIERCANRGWEVVSLETMPDRVRLVVRTDPTDAPAFVANQLEGYTSRVLRAEFPHLRSKLPTLWSRSYFISSVGHVSASTIKHYIEHQKTTPPEYGKRKAASLSAPGGSVSS
jgi:putative transposase